jgi:hypothetical protein
LLCLKVQGRNIRALFRGPKKKKRPHHVTGASAVIGC